MKRKKLAEIKTKEDRQEFLNYLLAKELEKIRLKIYKYQRRNVLWNPITIKECDFEDYSTAGRYEWDKETEEHRIQVSSRLLNMYLCTNYHITMGFKSYDKRQVVDTIGHEICHGLVQEKFEHMYRTIKHKNRDGSPVFLATLQYLDYQSGHYCGSNYLFTKVWRDINELKKSNGTWSDFRDYIFKYLQQIKDIENDFNESNKILGRSISFSEFSARGSGLVKDTESCMEVTAYIKNKHEFRNINVSSVGFEIGSMMDIETIKRLLHKKLNNNVKANITAKSINKVMMNDETKYSKFVYKKEENYNKYKEKEKIAERIK